MAGMAGGTEPAALLLVDARIQVAVYVARDAEVYDPRPCLTARRQQH